MKKAYRILTALCLLLVLACFGCAGRPDEQIRQAQKALDQAKQEHAEEFAPAEWKNAQEAWNEAQTALDKKSYGSAYSILLRVKSRFERARDIAKGRRDNVRREAEQMQNVLDARYRTLKIDTEASKRISGATRKKLEASFKEIDKVLDKLNGEMQQGDYTPAKKTAEDALQRVYEAEKLLRGR